MKTLFNTGGTVKEILLFEFFLTWNYSKKSNALKVDIRFTY